MLILTMVIRIGGIVGDFIFSYVASYVFWVS